MLPNSIHENSGVGGGGGGDNFTSATCYFTLITLGYDEKY